MLSYLLLLILGLTVLWAGAELLIRNSSTLARSMGISPVIIGLTVISMGTSLPEFVVSFMAALQNTMGISIGNIIGSNIANIGLILGSGAFISNLEVKKSWVFKEVPAMIFFTLVFFLFANTGHIINRFEGSILVIFLFLFLYYLWRSSAQEMREFKEFRNANSNNQISIQKKLFYLLCIFLGIVLLIGGSKATVSSGVKIARALHVSDTVIGLTLIAVGTSLPELATTIVGVLRNETDIVVGNIIGSNIFNLLFIGGVIPLIRPIPVESSLFVIEFPALLLLSVLVWPLMRVKWNVHRYEGLLLLVLYFIFLWLAFR